MSLLLEFRPKFPRLRGLDLAVTTQENQKPDFSNNFRARCRHAVYDLLLLPETPCPTGLRRLEKIHLPSSNLAPLTFSPDTVRRSLPALEASPLTETSQIMPITAFMTFYRRGNDERTFHSGLVFADPSSSHADKPVTVYQITDDALPSNLGRKWRLNHRQTVLSKDSKLTGLVAVASSTDYNIGDINAFLGDFGAEPDRREFPQGCIEWNSTWWCIYVLQRLRDSEVLTLPKELRGQALFDRAYLAAQQLKVGRVDYRVLECPVLSLT